jgi:signal transduction histidine kinase
MIFMDSPLATLDYLHFGGRFHGFIGRRPPRTSGVAILAAMQAFLFIARKVFAWAAGAGFVIAIWAMVFGRVRGVLIAVMLVTLVVVALRAFSHVRRVRLITESREPGVFASRHRRRIEIPFGSAQAFDMLDATVRELPFVEFVDSVRDSLQIRARVKRIDPYLSSKKGPKFASGAAGARRNLILATIAPGESAASVTLICEPEGGAWVDWFMVDDGTNLENADAITRALSQRISERRKGEEASVRQTEIEKELTTAKLGLLQAQVEPHFLYNTLASAQLLARNDAGKAERMLGNLITYLRHSLPRTEGELSTVGDEVERARAYLEIMRIRMGDRLAVEIDVPDAFRIVPMPPMMLLTLVENAIKHGLEPTTGGGTVWINARESDGRLLITVADDGRGFSVEGGGTGVGLRNVRERLRLAYGEKASFTIVSNHPNGVAATIALPLAP